MFELVEASFDAVALGIDLFVEGSLLLAKVPWRDDCDSTAVSHMVDDLVRIVPFVCKDGLCPVIGQQLHGVGKIAMLAGADAELQRQAALVGQQVNLGAQSSSRTPQSRVF